MLSHLSFGVADLEVARRFYGAVLAPLGLVEVWKSADAAGYGAPGGEDIFAIKQRALARAPGSGFHLAFNASSPAAVDRWHGSGLTADGKDEGAPGLRPHYGEHYYAAFLRDPDNFLIEAVCNVIEER